jgi:hypothetical protein
MDEDAGRAGALVRLLVVAPLAAVFDEALVIHVHLVIHLQVRVSSRRAAARWRVTRSVPERSHDWYVRVVTRNAHDQASFGTMAAVVGYVGEDETLELRLSPDGDELAIFDLLGQRRPCAARLTADRRAELAAALARMAETAQRSEYSDVPAKVSADGGGRVDIAALPAAVAIYVFRPGAWASRSVRLAPADARRLAGAVQPGGAGDALPSSG